MNIDRLRYPIGKFKVPENITPAVREGFIKDLELLPQQMNEAVTGLSEEQLDTPYRPEGWTIRQLVHHIPDSHLNSYIRFKWALTESEPLIKAYDEKEWAQLKDSLEDPCGNVVEPIGKRTRKVGVVIKKYLRRRLEQMLYPPGNWQTDSFRHKSFIIFMAR